MGGSFIERNATTPATAATRYSKTTSSVDAMTDGQDNRAAMRAVAFRQARKNPQRLETDLEP
jgi:hypothetical protein